MQYAPPPPRHATVSTHGRSNLFTSLGSYTNLKDTVGLGILYVDCIAYIT